MRYIAKPVEIEAIQFKESYTSDNSFEEIQKWTGTHTTPAGHVHNNFDWADNWLRDTEEIIAVIWVEPSQQWAGVKDGDYIVKDANGDFYPCVPDIFEMKYEPMESGGVITSREVSSRIQQSRRFQG